MAEIRTCPDLAPEKGAKVAFRFKSTCPAVNSGHARQQNLHVPHFGHFCFVESVRNNNRKEGENQILV